MTHVAPPCRSPQRTEWRLMLVMMAVIAGYATVAVSLGVMALSSPAEPERAGTDTRRPPVRGPITDRQGRLLAANLPAWSLYAHPGDLRDPGATAAALAPVFPDLTAAEIEARLDVDRDFVWVRRPVTPRQKQAIMDLRPAQPALKFGRRDMRVYPAGRIGAHLMGGVKAGEEHVTSAELAGNGGVEQAFDSYLRDPAALAEPLALSIDLTVQAALTEVLAEGVTRFGARRGSAILMDVTTGELRAMVSLPDFDPNAPVRRLDGGAANPRFHQAVSGVYELGSVFKPITAAIAMDAGLASPDSMIRTGEPIREGGHRIRDIHRMPPLMTVTDIVRRSSNVGSARLAMRLGTEGFRAALDRLGMLSPLGIELPEAAKPMLPRRWTDLSTMTISFGHGLAVSPLHLLSAYAALANGGRRMVPSLARGGQPLGERVFSERTSRDMLEILRRVVTDGTATRADVPGYRVGGKTGTADKPRRNGRGYDRTKVLSSFASVFPVTSPKYAMLILLDEPTDPESGSRQASRTAVPVTAKAIRRLAPLLDLRPLAPETEPVASAILDAQTITVGLAE